MSGNGHGSGATDQLAPHSIEAEEAVIGSILLSPEAFAECDWLKVDDFFLVRHGWIWQAIKTLVERKQPVDQLTIMHELEGRGQLAEVGGAAYIISLINKTPSALNVEGYAHIVERMALRRGLIEAAQKIARSAHSDETDINTVVAESEAALSEAIDGRIRRNSIRSVGDIASVQLDEILSSAAGNHTSAGLPSGLDALDRLLGGFRRGELIYIAARPGMGKSALLQQIAGHIAGTGIPVGIVSWEMNQESITTRLLSGESGLPYLAILDRRLNETQLTTYVAAVGKVDRWPIYIEDDVMAATPSGLRRVAHQLRFEHDIQALFVDYIQLMHADWRLDNRVQEISLISRQLKALAMELNIPVVALSQLSRAVEQRSDRRPMLSDLRESGSLEQDADIVGFIYRDAYYDAGTKEGNAAEIIIAKHRNGPTGTVDTVWISPRFRFTNSRLWHVDLNTGKSWVDATHKEDATVEEPDGPILNLVDNKQR